MIEDGVILPPFDYFNDADFRGVYVLGRGNNMAEPMWCG